MRSARSVRGQSSVEYLLLASLVGLALVLGPDRPLDRLVDAFGAAHARFTYALSRP